MTKLLKNIPLLALTTNTVMNGMESNNLEKKNNIVFMNGSPFPDDNNNEYKFQKTITAETYERILSEAELRLKDSPDAHEKVKAHWQSIVDGVVPFGYKVIDE